MDISKYYETYHTTYGESGYKTTSTAELSRNLEIKEMVSSLLSEGDLIADIGCSDRYYSKALPQYRWVNIDISNELDKDIIKHDIMTKPYPITSNSLDMAICSEVLEHVWDPRIVHEEMMRCLKPGGYWLISTPNYDSIDHKLTGYKKLLYDPTWSHLIEHIRQYNLETHVGLLKAAGFEIKDYVGADAHESSFFKEARVALYKLLGEKASGGQVDRILGSMFRTSSPTIIVLARKPL